MLIEPLQRGSFLLRRVSRPAYVFQTEYFSDRLAHGLTFRELIETSLRHTLEEQSSAGKPFRLRKVTYQGKGQRIQDGEAIRAIIYQGRGG
jgi:hypothetical protein